VIVGVWLDGVQRQSDERATLIAQLRASQAEVAQLSHDAGVAAERQRLAGDIHDTIAQGLSSVIMLIQAAGADPAAAGKHLDLALDTARDNLAEARALVAALSPTALDGTPLPAALRRLAEHSAVPASFTVDGVARPLATSIDVVLLRAAQEALTNVRKHAEARSATVALSYQDGLVTLTVRDDGKGLSAEPGGGYGLAAMRGRVEQVDGTLRVDSAPGTGATVRVEVPTA
jgi:signal transduction histidine kinase